jgi:hypothetical protein
MGKEYAYRLIRAKETTDNLSGLKATPLSETHIRPLTFLAPEQQREVWQKAVEIAPDGKITAAEGNRCRLTRR